MLLLFCPYWFFHNGFKFWDSPCNGCLDLSKMLCLSLSNAATITVKNVDYRYGFYNIRKSEETDLLKTFVLDDYRYV